MLNHHIQKGIIYRLALTSPTRFSDLKPDDLDNKLFSYHLKIVMNEGLVEKNSDGLYLLTGKGKALGIHVYSAVSDSFRRALSILLFAVRYDNKWLMYRRKNEPLKDLVGFLHCEPEAGITVEDKASTYLKEVTSIDAKFKVAGSGIASTYLGSEIESYTSFIVLVAETQEASIVMTDNAVDVFWISDDNLSKTDLLPNTLDIINGLSSSKMFFIDKTYKL